jgi:tRNA (guanine10-N2)-dimethyltransferase
MQSVMILGRQPELGLAELESLYGADKIRAVGSKAAVVDVDPCLLAFERLGSSVKFCKLLTTVDTVDWKAIETFLIEVSPGHSERMPEGKLLLGLSIIDLKVGLKQLEATGLSIKKAIRKTGRPVRLVPNKTAELNAAQIIHNKLTGQNGWELVLIRDGDKTLVAQTVKVQDIESYTERDRGRPKRDAKVGMLPPKLAQTIINLATGPLSEETLTNICDIPADQELPLPRLGKTLLDPFCGTGVVLQEAALMGYDVYGTDLEQRMVEYAEHNLAWLGERVRLPAVCCRVEHGDATDYVWKEPIDMVVAETYLGRPFTRRPDAETLARTISDCNLIIKKFLQNLAPQLQPDTRLCLAVPAWHTGRGDFKHLPLIDQISDLGYNRVSFEHVRDDQLLYHREDQVVARQLLVITRK